MESPTDTVSMEGDNSTAIATWDTVTAALAETAPAVAVTVAVPLPAAVTSPAPSTVATPVLLLVQATAAPVIGCPFWSRTAARSCTVWSSAAKSTVGGVTVIAAGRAGAGGGGSGGSAVSPPQPEAQAAIASATDPGTNAPQRLNATS